VEALVTKKGTVRLVRINIKRWDSPVARQFGINRIPALWLYDGTERKTTSTSAVLAALKQ
jgi:thioredoxin-like negative regulator of GroEL